MTEDRMVVDDHLVLSILLDAELAALRPGGAQVFTTGLWYHRLCRAISNQTVTGVLSRSLGGAPPAVAASASAAIISLPDSLDLLSLRQLAWPMARLIDDGVRLNLLSLEALAATEHLGAELLPRHRRRSRCAGPPHWPVANDR